MRTSRNDRLAMTETCWLVPNESAKGCGTKSRVLRPTTETGFAGSLADSATDMANGTFLAYSAWISFSSSGKSNSVRQSSGSHWSFGSEAAAVWQVDISGAKAIVP